MQCKKETLRRSDLDFAITCPVSMTDTRVGTSGCAMTKWLNQ
jgi:hypothetical protein